MQALVRLLIITVMIARGVVPVGFMPAIDHHGTMHVVICTGHGIRLGPDKQGAPGQPGKKTPLHGCICPFASSAPIAIAAVAPELPTAFWTMVDSVAVHADVHFVSRAVNAAHPRAPPFRHA